MGRGEGTRCLSHFVMESESLYLGSKKQIKKSDAPS